LDLILGVWILTMPFVVGEGLPMSTVVLLAGLGLIAVADALWALIRPATRSPEWVMGAVGLVLFVTPWALGFAEMEVVAWNAWIIGAILAIDAGIASWVSGNMTTIPHAGAR